MAVPIIIIMKMRVIQRRKRMMKEMKRFYENWDWKS